MALELTPAILVRIGSGFLFVLLGVATLALGRWVVANAAFGVWAIAFGLTFASNNLLLADPATATLGIVLGVILGVVSAVALAVATLSGFGTGGPLRGRDLGLVVALGAVVYALLLVRLPASELYISFRGLAPDAPRALVAFGLGSFYGPIALMLAYVALAATRARRATDPRTVRRLAVGGAAFAVYPAYILGSGILQGLTGTGPYGVLFLIPAAGAWLVAMPSAGRPARAVAWTILLAALLGLVDAALGGGGGVQTPSPMPGLARMAAVALFAYGILRHRFLGFELALPTARRGTLATIGLVGFFAVAQVAQTYLSGTMGVVLGGVAAGVLLFAAAPLQRAAERLASHETPVVESGRRAAPSLEEAYRSAVRAAMRDGVVTRREERHLADVAERLGIGPAAALRIREDVEREPQEVR